ncbi:MAG: hypothetical protein JW797_05745 [Bradymonadales bacterium]|nr:hypothetical protein [Bradymonadales bacterium]
MNRSHQKSLARLHAPSERQTTPLGQVQLRRELSGMTYSEQVARATPPYPVMLSAQPPPSAHQTAAEGLSGSSGPLPHLGPIQQSFGGHDVSPAQAQVGGKAAEANKLLGSNGQRSSVSGGIQLAREQPTSYPSKSVIMAKTCEEFVTYTEQQLDWANNPALNPNSGFIGFFFGWMLEDERKKLWAYLRFLREKDFHRTSCGELKISDLESQRLSLGDSPFWSQLATYAAARGGDSSRPLPKLDVNFSAARDALRVGKDVQQLETKVGGDLSKRIFTHAEILNIHSRLQEFIDYVVSCNPLLHAGDGKEIVSFRQMQVGFAAKYKKPLNTIRNFHRFTNAALDHLYNHPQNPKPQKPFTLVLHTALDESAAFHQDANLEKVITDSHNFTWMVEGPKSIGDAKSLLQPMATQYGKDGKIDQVLIAGHGSPTSVEFAGDTDASGNVTTKQSLEVNQKDTEQFFKELIGLMDVKSANRRIVLDACLTGATELDLAEIQKTSKSSKPGAIQAAAKKYLKTHPNMVSWVDSMSKDIDVFGASAATTGGLTMIDQKSGKLELNASDDPAVMKRQLDYIKEGQEPIGVVSATIEGWSLKANLKNPKKCPWMAAIDYRLAHPRADWREPIITAALNRIKTKYSNNLSGMQAMIGAVSALYFMEWVDKCNASWVNNALPSGDEKAMLTDANAAWSQPFTYLAGYLVWMLYDSAKYSDFMWALQDPYFNDLDKLKKYQYFDLSLVLPHVSALVKIKTYPKARRLLCLAVIDAGKTNIDVETILKKAATKNKNRLPKYYTSLLGTTSEDQILIALGLKKAPSSSSAPSSAPLPDYNVDTDESGKTDTYFEPVSYQVKVTVKEADIKESPDSKSKTIKTLKQDHKLWAAGLSEDHKWTAVELHNSLYYIDSTKVGKA